MSPSINRRDLLAILFTLAILFISPVPTSVLAEAPTTINALLSWNDVANRIFSRSCVVSFAIASRSPESTVLKGSTLASSGLALTTAGNFDGDKRPRQEPT